MNKVLNTKKEARYIILFLIFFIAHISVFAQTTTIKGIIKDSETNEPLPFVTIKFDDTPIGTFSKEDGQYTLSNNSGYSKVTISFLGYNTRHITIPLGKNTTYNISLQSEDLVLKEVVVKPKKEKYSKKDNPAVELIKNVIANKDNNNIHSQEYFKYEEYERLTMALNEFKPNQSQFKRFKFLPRYIDKSLIDSKDILPISIRETISDVYYKKSPVSEKRIIKGYQHEGIDQTVETEGLDAIISQVFKDISIYDNNIIMLFQSFVGPLSSNGAVNFYKWYIEDTITIDDKKYIDLSFAPFNNRDVGFTGHLYISTDGNYGVKRAILRAPHNMNINFVTEMVIVHEFKQNEYGKWVPDEFRTAIDLNFLETIKTYVEKTQSFNKIDFTQQNDSIYKMEAPIIKEKDYKKRDNNFWTENRPIQHQKDYRMGEMMKDLSALTFIKIVLKGAELLSAGYFATNIDPEKNKVDIGSIPTFFSYNNIEGGRFRLTAASTKNMHPHLYLYGYAAYGLKDNKAKYKAEATWAFNKIEKHKDEFPKHNITLAFSYDLNDLGQRYLQIERDNILMSLKSSTKERLTYSRSTQLIYEREYYGGLSGQISANVYDGRPAGNLQFSRIDPLGNVTPVRGMQTSELSIGIRYAPKDVFFQQRRRRFSMPAEKFEISLNHTLGLKGVLGGEFNYNRTSLYIEREKWVAPFGKLRFSVQGEQLWGIVPFPLLITPSANNSYTIQSGNYQLVQPLEFLHDRQVSWEIYYHMGGWLFNRIPLLKHLKWREVAAFRGFIGGLNDKNNPSENRELMAFPEDSFSTRRKPYMEYNLGVENIFKFFRIDYVRRLSYLDHPDVDKDGIRISFDFTF